MPKNKTILYLQRKVVPILRKNGVTKAGIFGSYARGDAKKRSDIDILIQPPKGRGLKFIGLELELEEKLRRKVDLITYRSISPI